MTRHDNSLVANKRGAARCNRGITQPEVGRTQPHTLAYKAKGGHRRRDQMPSDAAIDEIVEAVAAREKQIGASGGLLDQV